jgi:hypothetical protein
VQAGDWLRHLEKVDAGTYVDVLVPITEDTVRATAARRIREARTLLREGKNDPAIMTARAALERIKTTPEVKSLFKSANNTPASKRSQGERWAVAVEAFYSLASGAAHDDEVTESFVYSRQDTEAIVAAVAGLVARYPTGSLQV